MVRIGVYRGMEKDKSSNLTLFNFDVLNELEETDNYVKSIQLSQRFNEWPEMLMEGRIYYINIIPGEKNKPINKYEILDKCKFITVDLENQFKISYRRYSGQNLIDLYEEEELRIKNSDKAPIDTNPNKLKEFIQHCQSLESGERLAFNTFTKFILDRILSNYGYEGVIKYKDKKELKEWKSGIIEKVKNFAKAQDTKFSTWGKDEEEYLRKNINRPEKEIAKYLNRTVPSVATKKWKIRHEKTSKLKEMKTRSEAISEYLKTFRKEKGYNQKELKEASGISVSVISQLECGKYIGTDTPIVDELLKYIDKNSETLDINKIPQDVIGKHEEEDVAEDTTVEPQTKTPTQPKPTKVANTTNVDVSDLDVLEVLSELKFLSARLLKLENSIIAFNNSNGKRQHKASITLAEPNKTKQTA